MSNLIKDLKNLIIEAGKIAITIREVGLIISYKDDNSPVTNADKEISDFIYNGLKILTPDIPVICEEREIVIIKDDNFWLVDPIDGTSSYMGYRDTYTVNIALIKNNIPVMGLIYQPAIDKLYYTDDDNSLKIEQNGKELACDIASNDYLSAIISSRSLNLKTKIFVDQLPKEYLSYEVSLDMVNLETSNFLKKYPIAKITSIPSSIKLCLIAEGKFDIYPKFGETMGWDIAAGHALIKANGGNVVDLNGKELEYKNNYYQNPDFYAYSKYWLIKNTL